jgi:hypothetical protein
MPSNDKPSRQDVRHNDDARFGCDMSHAGVSDVNYSTSGQCVHLVGLNLRRSIPPWCPLVRVHRSSLLERVTSRETPQASYLIGILKVIFMSRGRYKGRMSADAHPRSA